MNVPKLPADSLYKFITVAGLVLSIFSLYMQYETGIELSKRFENIEIADEVNRFELHSSFRDTNQNQSFDNDVLKAKLDSVRNAVLIRNIKDDIASIPEMQHVFLFLTVIGAIVTALGGIMWYYKIQVYQNKIIRLQADRYENEKLVKIHELQFNKEFEIYTDLWKKLAVLQSCAVELLPDNTEEFQKLHSSIEKHETLKLAINYFGRIVIVNKPFYTQEIFEPLTSITWNSQKYLTLIEMEGHSGSLNREKFETLKTIVEAADHVCEAIRSRIRLANTEGA